jgi:site-specific DNA recombinase
MAVVDRYIRVSRVGGRHGEAYGSPETQRAAISAWVGREGLRPGVEVVEEDVPGSRPVRERGLERLVRRAERGESSGIAVYRIDRLGRDLAEVVVAAKRLKDAGARLVAVADSYDSDTQMGNLTLGLFASLAVWHLDLIRENWRAATSRAVARGVHVACRAPVGYLRADAANGEGPRDGRLVPDEATAEHVAHAFRMRADGASYQSIIDRLAAEAGVRMSKSGAAAMLRNPAYLGQSRGPNGAALEGAHEPLVSPEVFEAVQMRRRPRPQPRPESASAGALLAGLITCAGCGHRLRVVCEKTRTRDPFYSCAKHYGSGECPAPAHASVPRVDGHVAELLAASAAEVEARLETAESRLLRAREDVRAAEDALDGWVSSTAIQRELGRDRFELGLATRQRELDEARQQLFDLGGDDPDGAVAVWLDGRPWRYSRWGEDVEADRATLRRAIASVTLANADPRRRRWQPIAERVEVAWRGQE